MFVNVKVSDLDYRLLAAGYREVARRLVFRRWGWRESLTIGYGL